jgi:uncharacterized protein
MQLWRVERKSIEIEIAGIVMIAHWSGALFIPEDKALIVADLHIGKAEHFRRNGIPLPKAVNDNNFWNLAAAIQDLNPNRIVFLGDVIHSAENTEWVAFADFLDNFRDREFVLVRGNHDKQPKAFFEGLGMSVIDSWTCRNILFSHEPSPHLEFYNISGHIHPAVVLVGAAQQSIRLPCFYFTKKSGLLPAFGSFTGAATVSPRAGDRVLVLLENKILDFTSKISSQR